jgi:hypothetical protein
VTIEEAEANVGSDVIYRPLDAKPRTREERGVIVRAGAEFVFVRYGRQTTPKATHPAALRLAAEGE